MITRVYTDTVLGEKLSLYTWHELALEHGKCKELIKYLEKLIESLEEQEQ